MKKLLAACAVFLFLVPTHSLYGMKTRDVQEKWSTFKQQVSVPQIKRTWNCLTKPKASACSIEEQKRARKWLVYTPIAVVISLLAIAGIIAIGTEGGREAIRKLKIDAIPSVIQSTYTRFQQQYDELRKAVEPSLESLKQLYAQIKKSINAFQAQFEKLNITAFELDAETNSYLQRLFTMLNNVADFVKNRFKIKLGS